MNLKPAAGGDRIGRAAWLGTALAVLVIVLPLEAQPAEPPNLVANGEFSQVTHGKPDRWQTAGNDKDVTQELRVVTDAAGKSCAQLVCTRCEGGGPASHAMLAQLGAVTLVEGHVYEFSCRMRAEGIASRTVGVALQETQGWLPCGLFKQLSVGSSWKTAKHVFTAARSVGPTGRLQIWFTEPGTLYVADVRIVECVQREVQFTDVVPSVGGRNLVVNGSFEAGEGGWSSLGAGAGWGDLDCLHGSMESSGGTHGRSFLRVPLGAERTPVLYFDYFEPVVRRELRPLAATRGWIPLETRVPYTLSCDMRASVEGVRAVLGVRAKDPAGPRRDYRLAVNLSTSWKRYSYTFRPEHRFAFVTVGPDMAGEERVDVDIDAVQLEKGERATAFEPRTPVEFSLEPTGASGVIPEGKPASLVVQLANHLAQPARTKVTFRVTDFEDKPVAWPEQSIDVPGGSTVRRELAIPADWKGFYRVRAAAVTNGKTESADVRLAVVPRRTSNDSVCGINHAFASSRLIDLASQAGVTWYRDWSLKWQHLEPSKGEFRWDVGDAQIDRVLHEGVHVLPLMPPFPSADWASEAPATLPTTGYPGVRLRQAWGPKDPADLGDFVGRTVSRYKDRLHVWEFLNEPVYTSYALPADRAGKFGGKRYGVADYVALLRVASAAMRKADPSCKVMGGIAGGPRELTREVIEAGCLSLVDLFNLHIYPGSKVPEGYLPEMDALLALMDAHSGRKPIWMTEFSYYGADDLPRSPFFPLASSWSEERLVQSERQCAEFTVRFFAVMLSHGVEKIFLHSGASGTVNDPNFECALFDYGGAPRKLVPALAVFTELLGASPRTAGFRRLGETGYAAAFETGGHSLLVVWGEEDAVGGRATSPAGDEVHWLDMMGKTMPSRTVNLAGSPAYLLGPPGKAKDLLASVQFTVR